MAKRKLGPVQIHLTIKDCCDCPFCDADEAMTICEVPGGPSDLSIYETPESVVTPPENCPFRANPREALQKGDE